MPDDTIYMTPMPENTGVILMDPLPDLTGTIYMDPITPIEQEKPWQYVGSHSFSLLYAVLISEWVSTPGITSNCAQVVLLPAGISEVKIVPTGGYQMTYDAAIPKYGVGIEFKTDIGFLRMMLDTNNNRIPDSVDTSAEAAAYWLSLGPQTIVVGSQRFLGWGCGDDPLINGSPAISFLVFAR